MPVIYQIDTDDVRRGTCVVCRRDGDVFAPHDLNICESCAEVALETLRTTRNYNAGMIDGAPDL